MTSTIYIPKHIRKRLFAININELTSFPYDPIEFNENTTHLPVELRQIATLFKAEKLFISNTYEEIVGFFVAFSSNKDFKVDLSLISIINKQISSLIYRSNTSKKIEVTKQFYQEIIDYLSSIIVVLDNQFEIIFKNKYFDQFFKKTTSTLTNLMDFPSLEVVHK